MEPVGVAVRVLLLWVGQLQGMESDGRGVRRGEVALEQMEEEEVGVPTEVKEKAGCRPVESARVLLGLE